LKKFSPDQQLLALILAAVLLGLTAYRWFFMV
jgi:hypothetical protein